MLEAIFLQKAKKIMCQCTGWLLSLGFQIQKISQVNHIDGNKLNNSTSNLEWVTLQENNLHCCRILGKRRGVTNSQSKFTEDQIRAIRQDNRTLHEIAKDYGCYFSTIHKIKKFETWQHVK